MNTDIRQGFVRAVGVVLGLGVWVLLLGPMAGAITLSYAESSPPTSSQQPVAVSKINRALPGAQTGMLLMVKDKTAQINGISYPLAQEVLIESLPPGVMIESHSGVLRPVSVGWEKLLHYPLPVQYWIAPGQTAISQMILTSPVPPTAPRR